MKGIFVTATDTNVGKTWIGSRLIRTITNSQLTITVRKPVESGWPEDAKEIKHTDAWLLAEAADQLDELSSVCPYRFKAAISPDRAAHLENTHLTIEHLRTACLKNINEDEYLYVEGAGGLYSPLCDDGLNADLARELKLPVLLVVENRLGCINQTLLNIEAIKNRGLELKAIALNQTNSISSSESDLGMNNLNDIQKRVSCEVVPFTHQDENKDSFQRLMKYVLS